MTLLLLAACSETTLRERPRGPEEVTDETATVEPPNCTTATFLPAGGGAAEDRTAEFGLGETVVLDRPGALVLCDRSWQAGLIVSADVTISGAGAAFTTLDGGGVRQVIRVEDGAALTLEGLSIVGGEGNDGGGVMALGGGDLTLRGITLRTNHAGHQGGGVWVEGPRRVWFEDVRFEDNDANSAGGGAFVRDVLELTVVDGAFVGNRAVGDGGGLRLHGGLATLSGTTFEQNRSEDRGGGLSVDSAADVTGTELVFTGNPDGRVVTLTWN